MRPAQYSVMLFDLDGTLLDTAPDLGNTASAVSKKHGLSGIISDKRAREQASDGMRSSFKGLRMAMKEFSAPRKAHYYAGDHIRDMEAAGNAGMTAILACRGYLPRDMPRESLGADFLAETTEKLLDFALAGKAQCCFG